MQEYDIIVDPEIDMKVSLSIGQQEAPLLQVYRVDKKPNYVFRGKYKSANIGLQTITLEINGKSFKQEVRLKPVKISQQEYEAILKDIQSIVYNVIYDTFGKTEEKTELWRAHKPKSPLEFFSFFEKHFADFKQIFAKIEKTPNMITTEKLKTVDFLEDAGIEEVQDYERPPKKVSTLQDKLEGFLPKSGLAPNSNISYDVYENRLLRHFLNLIIGKLSYLQEIALKEERREMRNREIYGDTPETCADFQKRIEQWQKIKNKCIHYKRDSNQRKSAYFLQELSKLNLIKTSMVLQNEPRYKAFYQLYQKFQQNSLIEIHSEYSHLPVIDAWKIFETWVILKTYTALRKTGFQISKQNLVTLIRKGFCRTEDSHFSFDFIENEMLFELRCGNRIARLFYQRRYLTGFSKYGSVDEQMQVPDISIEIFDDNQEIPQIVILDSKYRIEGDKPPDSSKKDLSHYKNTIRDQDDYRIVKNAFVVYPGKLTECFGQKKDYGYIGLLPSESSVENFERKIRELVMPELSA